MVVKPTGEQYLYYRYSAHEYLLFCEPGDESWTSLGRSGHEVVWTMQSDVYARCTPNYCAWSRDPVLADSEWIACV